MVVLILFVSLSINLSFHEERPQILLWGLEGGNGEWVALIYCKETGKWAGEQKLIHHGGTRINTEKEINLFRLRR